MSRKYVVARIGVTLLMALAATLVVFLVAHFVPVDPIQAQLGDLASSKPEIVARYRAHWGLDKPLWEQYLVFLQKLCRGDLGQSIATRRPVLDDIKQYAPASFELATLAIVLAVVIGIPLGVLAAIKRDSWLDHLARGISLVGVSAPTFWLAFIALALFYGGLEIAPSPGRLDAGASPPPHLTGLYLLDSLAAGDLRTFASAFAHLLLPGMVLAATTTGVITRTTRASMLDTLDQDYIRTARAKGVREWGVLLRHALRNALIPIFTLGGVAYAQLLSGAVMTESIFAFPGMGRYAFQSAVVLDFPAISGITLVVGLTYLIVNLAVDLSYAAIDPRVVRR
ncbi:MAG TPA: ABC transporter permease [Candidatus Methylomirabilis sp.]|nr:ABC transporter permease [Candidatus Methylomirabilis sp.]